LKFEVLAFIDSMQTNDPQATARFRADSISWWNANYQQALCCTPNFVPPQVALSAIEGIQHLQFDSLHLSGDTIKGLFNVELYDFSSGHNWDRSNYCLDTNNIYLVLDQQKKISAIINYSFPEMHDGLVQVQCFFMDESEINSNAPEEWLPPTVAELDSMQQRHNDFRMIPAAI